jgi:hypothetical protein
MNIALGFLPLLLLGVLIAGVWAGFRSLSPGHGGDDPESMPIDTAEAAKSIAIHVGLFLSLVVCAVGMIDVLQSFVESSRIAGTTSDLARGLSLIIVGGPVYALLLRTVDRRYAERAKQGDARPHLGWSVYLIAALTMTLIASLVSVSQVADRLTDDFDDYRPEELIQLLVWVGLWVAHWFGLRPRFRVRGDAHLAIGSIIGLGWMITGIGAVVFRVFDEAYQSVFDASLAGSYNITFWLVIALAGAAVWAWHWLGNFNVGSSVEGDRRRSPMWFFTVIVAGVLPGLIAMLVSTTVMVSGVLIWFIGSTNEDAVDFFEPATILLTVLALGFVSWAYHRWELDRGGRPDRNESLRFHDYMVVATSLVGVVGAAAVVIGQLIEAIAAESGIAGSLDITNTLIVAVTVLLASAAVWWTQWSIVERHRAEHAFDESDSIFRKLYLIAAFGIGGLVLSVSTIWVLFVLLRDLLDSQTSHDTLGDLVGPVGWGVAVLGAVWYHLGVWRVDRTVLAAHAPPKPAGPSPLTPPAPSAGTTPASLLLAEPAGVQPAATSVLTAAAGITLRQAEPDHAGELFTLMRAVGGEQALQVGSLDVVGLRESFADLQARLATGTMIVAVDGSRIVGVIMRTAGSAALVEQPLVVPDRRNEGIESLLLAEAGA